MPAEQFLFVSYLGFAVTKLAQQALLQSRSTRRDGLRIGLRLTALGCVIWLVYAAFQLKTLFSLNLRLDTTWDGTHAHRTLAALLLFSVASPALATLLICLGLTAPAVLYTLTRARRHRWEIRSFNALRPIWQDLSDAMPHIVLPATDPSEEAECDSGFFRNSPIPCSTNLLKWMLWRITRGSGRSRRTRSITQSPLAPA